MAKGAWKSEPDKATGNVFAGKRCKAAHVKMLIKRTKAR